MFSAKIIGPPQREVKGKERQNVLNGRTRNAKLSTMRILVNIDVPDLDGAIRFYSDALGLQLTRRLGPTGAELVGASSSVYLLEKPLGSLPFPGAPSLRSYLPHWTPVHVDFVCDDIEAAVARALGAVASLENPITAYAWGSIAALADPFGNGFCLIEFSALGYDAIAT